MPLQNRVDPFGQIHALPGREMFTGNRGVIHDPCTKTLTGRRWTTRAWIICECVFKDRRREVMGRNARSGGAGWTELFFPDEVTALAAGHRPCFECRRERARDFLGRFGEAFGLASPKVADLDGRLHRERLASGGQPVPLDPGDVRTLPDGAIVADGGTPYGIKNGFALRWSFAGYSDTKEKFNAGRLELVTPATTLAVLRHGYQPRWHGSAQQS